MPAVHELQPPTRSCTTSCCSSQSCQGPRLAPPSYGIALADTGRSAVQAREQLGARKRTPQEIHTAARQGVASSSASLPHLDRIQQSFGSRFDVSSIRAHVGQDATAASRRMGAQGYAMGEHVVFREPPSLHLAAHEAAHVIQQRSGVQLRGGVGEARDAHEQHAEAVAQRVVAGESAEALLDAAPGRSHVESPASVAVQRLTDKEVSNTALVRLQMAKGAMQLTKSVLKHGAGNQVKALQSSKLNTHYRMLLARDIRYWDVDPAVNDLITADQGAYEAARAYVAAGGNCGEHGQISYEFLKRLAKGQRITLAAKKGLDHAFVLIGDLSEVDGKQKEPDSEIAVADAWPTAPTATIWEDHFAHTSKRSDIDQTATTIANGSSSMMAIVAGIKPNDKGKELLTKTGTDADVQAKLARFKQDLLWDHEKSAASGKEFTYFTKDAMERRVDLK